MPGQWFVMGRDTIHGPYSKEHVLRLIEAGRIKPTTQVRNGNVGPWLLASKVPGLFSAETGRNIPSNGVSLTPGLKLGLIVGGAVAGTAVLTAGICIVFLGLGRGDAVAPQQMPVAVIPAAGSQSEAEPADDGPLAADPEAETEPKPQADEDEVVAAAPQVVSAEPPPAQEPAAAQEAERIQDEAVPAPAIALEPKPMIPPVPAEKLPIEDAKITEFNKSVRLEMKGKDGYARYLAFSQSFAFTDEQRARIDTELADWKERADKDLHRLGSEWVALEKVQAAEKEADKLIERAFALIKTGSYAACVDLLEEASRVNPNGIRADYTLGLLNSLPIGFKAPAIAEKHFRKVLLRSPNHPAAFNSLAISQLKQADFVSAFANFARAAELTPKCQEVAHNLGRAVMLAEQGRLRIEPGTMRRFTDLYSELIADERATAFEARTGWLHMRPIFPADEREEPPQQEAQPHDPQFVVAGWGSGFVIGPEVVATNRHVVHDETSGIADAVGIRDPEDKENKREIKGSVIAVSDTVDIALVRFPGLKLSPIQLSSKNVVRGEEVMILGYPQPGLLGTSMKSTHGFVSDLPNPGRQLFPELYLLDAISDRGNSGGPIIDRTGSAVAVLTAGIGLSLRVEKSLEAEFSAAVPVTKLIEFTDEKIPGFRNQITRDEAEDAPDWADTVNRVAPSVLHLTTYYKPGLAGLNLAGDRKQKVASEAWEDVTCPNCSGQSRVACPGKGCISGRVSVPYYVDEVVGSGMNRQVIRHKRNKRVPCTTCGGAGALDCQGCVGGVDRSLLR